MENFIIYIGKVSILLTLFFLVYHFLLRKETFFNSNRSFLLLGIITSIALPFLVFTKIIWVEPIVQDLSNPIKNSVAFNFISVEKPEFEINWFHVIGCIYLAGVIFFLRGFIRDILSLAKIIHKKEVKNQERFKFIDTEKVESPFSFFNYIIYNSNSFKDEELQNIIAHEKVHSSQYHSLDMLFSQIFCIFLWFNPFSWLHKKAIAQNLEFIADSVALKQVSDKIIYQKTLLKVSAPHHCIPITNHFFQSLIKKRIVMLNKNQSDKRNSWKYATVLPLLTLFMLQFQVETVAQQKEKTTYAVSSTYSDNTPAKGFTGMMILSSTSEKDLEEYIAQFKKSKKIKLSYSGIKRNDQKEIIEITLKYDDYNGTSGNQKFSNFGKPIAGILLEIKENQNGKATLKIIDLKNDSAEKNSTLKASIDSIADSNKNILKTKDPVLIVVDGKVKGMSDKVNLPEKNTIVSIDVLKNDISIEKYGNDGKNGVIVIVTDQKSENIDSGYAMSYKFSDSSENLENIKNNTAVDANEALIFIDSKEATYSDLLSLNPNKIISVSTTASNEVIIKKYGERAKKGVINVQTKKGAEKEASEVKVTDFSVVKSSSTFVIHKKNQEQDLKSYAKTLSKNNIIFNFSNIKRNKAGEIIAITIELIGKDGNKISRSWNNSEHPIPSISIGTSNNDLIILENKK